MTRTLKVEFDLCGTKDGKQFKDEVVFDGPDFIDCLEQARKAAGKSALAWGVVFVEIMEPDSMTVLARVPI